MEKRIEDYKHLYYPIELIDDKLPLRPLSDMTEEEKKEIFKVIFGRNFPETGSIKFHKDTSERSDPRWVLWSGVDRVGIEMSGKVWADCDLQPIKYNPHQVTRYLLSKYFDLFGLIESGLAIDKTKTT